MNSSYLGCLHNLITRLYYANKELYFSEISSEIFSVLFGNSENDKQVFFDFFYNLSSYDKNEISYTCINSILNRIDIALNCSNTKNITDIVNLAESKDKTLFVDINRYLYYGTRGRVDDELLSMISVLNRYERIALNSLCINCFRYSISSVTYNMEEIIKNKDDYCSNINKYKKNIIELLTFYIPVYNYFSSIDYIGKFDTDADYSYVYFITDLLHAGLNKMNSVDEIYGVKYLTYMYTYYMSYSFFINCGLGFFENDSHSNKVVDILLDGGGLDINDMKYLFDSYKLCDGLSSLEDRIEIIREISKLDHTYYDLFSNIDIAKYEVKQKKKRAFGLR